MNCSEYHEWLGDAVDGTLDTATRARLDSHCQTCPACRELFDDLLEIRAAAATLDRLTPSPATWDAIAAKIQSPQQTSARALVPGASSPMRLPHWSALAAAALLMMLGAAAWFGMPVQRSTPDDARTENSAELARNAASELQLAEQHYENAIVALERLTVNRDSTLDPVVAAQIAQSLQSIDRAINDSRAALKSEPNSFVAQTSLLEALRMKVALLQETVSLMNTTS
jgi:anti-sigma factor RsiW